MKNPFKRDAYYWPISWEQLAVYNAERLRGIKHERAWIEYMAQVQKEYNEAHGITANVVEVEDAATR